MAFFEGTSLADTLAGGFGADTLSGLGGNDTLQGALGDDFIIGGAGSDVAYYVGRFDDYTITGSLRGVVGLRGLEGQDTLFGVERLQFADATVTLNYAQQSDTSRVGATVGTLGTEGVAVITLADGQFIIFWNDLPSRRVHGQKFSREGEKTGQVIVVPSLGKPIEDFAACALQDGGFAVMWGTKSLPPDSGATENVVLQRFSPDGVPASASVEIGSSISPGYSPNVSVAGLNDGSTVSTWTEPGFQPGSSLLKLQIRVKTGEIVNSLELGGPNLVRPDLSTFVSTAGGGFVGVWFVAGGDSYPGKTNITVQNFDASGNRLGPEFIAASIWTDQASVSGGVRLVAMSDGRTAVLWEIKGAEANTVELHLGIFSSEGVPLVPAQTVNTLKIFSSSLLSPPELAYLANGHIVAAYFVPEAPNSVHGRIYGQRFSGIGQRTGAEFQISDVVGSYSEIELAASQDGGFLVSWVELAPGQEPPRDITVRRFDPTGQLVRALNSTAIVGNDTAQTIRGSAGDDAINGLGGNDVLHGLAGNDTLVGALGNDSLLGGSGVDTLRGGVGNDVYFVDRPEDLAAEESGQGVDIVRVSLESGTSFVLAANIEIGILTGPRAMDLVGNATNNTLTGNAEANTLNGAGGQDTLIGGLGDDVYVVDSISDRVTEGINAGTDQILVEVSAAGSMFVLLNNVENATLGIEASAGLRGNTLDNRLFGNSRENTLEGLAGRDSLFGMDGADLLVGGVGDDFLNGGKSIDSAGYAGRANDYVLEFKWLEGQMRVGGSEGTDTLSSVERLIFSDATLEYRELSDPAAGSTERSLASSAQSRPDIARLGNGGYALAYLGGNSSEVYLQIFAPSDDAIGPAARVNPTIGAESGWDEMPPAQVIALTGGGLVVVWWNGWEADGSRRGVFARQFGQDGAPIGAEFLVNTWIEQDQYNANALVLPDGGYLLTWLDHSRWQISAQRFSAEGEKQAGEFKISRGASVHTLTALDNGRYVLSLDSSFQILDRDFVSVGTETYLGETFINSIDAIEVARLPDDRFVVTFAAVSSESGREIFFRIFDAAGSPKGPLQRVNADITGTQRDPAVIGLSTGGFVVVWESSAPQGGSGVDVYAKIFTADGQVSTPDFLVHDTLLGDQSNPSVELLADGGFLIAWTSGSTLYTKRYSRYEITVTGDSTSQTLQGTPNEDKLFGAGGNDVLFGLGGMDLLDGGEGADTLNGGAGVDTLKGGLGDDVYFVDQLADVISELPGQGFDSVRLSISGTLNPYLLPAGIEAATLLSEFPPDVIGNELSNTLFGNSAGNRLEGSEGVDTLIGGAGSDVYVVRLNSDGTPEDLVVESLQADGTDILVLTGNYAGPGTANLRLIPELEDLDASGTGTSKLNLEGNDLGNRVIGNNAQNTLKGWAGQDFLNGLGGDDVLFGGTGNDSLNGGFGTDTAVYQELLSAVHLDIGRNGAILSVSDASGRDILSSVERITFADSTVSIISGVGRPDFRVNTEIWGDQVSPAIAGLNGGGFVVVWCSDLRDELDEKGMNVYGQRFSEIGNPVGDQFLVTSTETDDQYQPTVVALPDGGFVVAWTSFGEEVNLSRSVYFQRFGADGAAVGAEQRVTARESGFEENPALLALPDGSFIVAWQAFQEEPAGFTTLARKFSANGEPLTGETPLAPGPAFTAQIVRQVNPSLVLLEGGQVLVSTALEGDFFGGASGYAMRLFDQNLQPLTEPSYKPTFTFLTVPRQELVSIQAGGWMALSEAYDGFGSLLVPTRDIAMTRFADFAQDTGAPSVVNRHKPGEQYEMDSASLRDGGFVVTWTSKGQDGVGSNGVYAQRFSASGEKLGTEFRVNTRALGDQQSSSVAALEDGGFVVTWTSSRQDGSGFGIYAQRFDAEGRPLGRVGGISITGDDSSQVLPGSEFNDVILGRNGGDFLGGGQGNDTLSGENGDDTLAGGPGSDTLSGAAGADRYVFDAALDKSANLDRIVDFDAVVDSVALSSVIFAGVGAVGALQGAAFRASATGTAGDSDDRILYHTGTGILAFDSDGSGSGLATAFAVLVGAPSINPNNFVIF